MKLDEETRRKAVQKAAKADGVPYEEGVFLRGTKPPFTEVVVECALYPRGRWWVSDLRGGERVNRRLLTPEEWAILKPLAL